MILDNSNKVIDFSSWRVLEARLPALAGRALERKQVNSEDIDQYKKFAENERVGTPSWWKKNVVPTYSLSKTDIKNLAAISKDAQEAASVSILNLVVTNSDANRENSQKNLKLTTEFIQTGSAYIQLKALIDGYEANMKNAEASLQSKLSATEIEISFATQKVLNLEKLRVRFPSNVSFASIQIVDPNDSVAKYLPISTQLVAVNSDLNSLNESMIRLGDQHVQLKIMHDFLAQVNPVMGTSLNGLILCAKMLVEVDELRKTLDPQNIKQQNTVDGIHADLVAIQTRFATFMDRSEITSTRSGLVLPGVLGGVLGGFLTLLFLLGQRFWKSSKLKSGNTLYLQKV